MTVPSATPERTVCLCEAIEDLASAEEFLNHFAIAFDPAIVQVKRLHILQRFHDYIQAAGDPDPDASGGYEIYRDCLQRAYHDFVNSDAVTEKVFKVFQRSVETSALPSLVQIEG